MATGYTRFENDATPHPIAGPPAGQVHATPPPYFGGPPGSTPAICSQPQTFYANVAPMQPVVDVPVPVVVENYIGCAVIALHCCPVFGIAALVFSCMVRPRLQAGDIEGAKCASKSALVLSLLSVLFVMVTTIIVVIFWMVVGFSHK
ncbi:uncharacterized protein LOC119725509 isoform X2 [Patiria miniata]|uniref:Uncharacterized protein n=1 Tax=Patiria miniata TaxID=46514 RepID=A0A913ZP11_PATMI|nr:uncharacterized protein LOC119725509 isoform X1 [Patiria miniata]XP_038052850.1 uncharacterized protein LOC119725509 isoform X2 [Patiria miniata]